MTEELEHYTFLMQEALVEAARAFDEDEVPVGAVIAHQGNIIGRGHNQVEQRHDARAHAEMLAIEAASKELGDWRLQECTLVVTLEPCSMCLGAMKLSRISTIVFGLEDPRLGACGSVFDLSCDARLGPVPRVIRGIEEEACKELLQRFFQQKRKKGAS